MCSDELAVCRKGHVHQALLLQQRVHHRDDGRPMVVPFQAELLPRGSAPHHRSVSHGAQSNLQEEEGYLLVGPDGDAAYQSRPFITYGAVAVQAKLIT